MARALGTPHQACPSGLSSDYLALWRCNEANAFDDFTDAMGIRTAVAGGSGAVAADSPFADASQPAGRGARDFDGASSCGLRVGADGDEALFQSRIWGVSLSCRVDTLGRRALAYEEHSAAGVGVSNVQMQIGVTALGEIFLRQQTTAGGFIDTTTSGAGIAAGDILDIGVAAEPDPNSHTLQRVRIYKNDTCILLVDGVTPPDGGSAAKWVIGASRRQGTGVGTPGSFWDGLLDEIIVTKWSPSHEWFRWIHARRRRDFAARVNEGGDATDDSVLCEVHGRILVEVGPTSFTSIEKVNQTDIDLTNVNGIDFVQAFEWGESVDDADASATAELAPRFGFYNLSPFTTGVLRDLFRQRRRIKLEVAVVPVGTTRSGVGPHWELRYDGWALTADVAADAVRLTIAGKAAPLYGAWIEPAKDGGDRVYGTSLGQAIETAMQNVIDEMDPARFEILSITGAVGPAKIVANVHLVNVEHGGGRPHPFQDADSILVAGTINYNGVKTVDGAGTTATDIRTLETSAAAAETIGTIQGVPARSYLGGKPTIRVPTSPGWNIFSRPVPPDCSVGQLLEDWADEIGWRCANRFDAVRQEFRLTFYDPRSSPATVFRSAKQVLQPERLAVHHEDERTVGAVIYKSTANKDNALELTRWIRSFKDITNLRTDGRYYWQIDTGDQSLVNTQTEADLLGNAVLADVKDATAEGTVPSIFDPEPDVHDVLALTIATNYAPGSFDSSLGTVYYGAVAAVRHRIAGGEAKTRLELRKLSDSALTTSIARARRHLERMTQAGAKPGAGLSAPVTPAAPTVQALGAINGVRYMDVSWPLPVSFGNQAWAAMEVHVSTSTGFTPSAATLKKVQPGTGGIIAHGVGAGVVGYVKIVARDSLGNRSAASAQTAFTS